MWKVFRQCLVHGTLIQVFVAVVVVNRVTHALKETRARAAAQAFQELGAGVGCGVEVGQGVHPSAWTPLCWCWGVAQKRE